MNEFTLQVQTTNHYLLRGRVNFANAAVLHRQLMRALQQSHAQHAFALDLRDLTQLDTTLLALLLELHAQASLRQQSLQLDNPPPALRALAQLSEVEILFSATSAMSDG